MIAERGDFVMLHEPFADLAAKGEYALNGTRVASPGQAIDEIERISAERPVFFKDTTEYRHAPLFTDPRLTDMVAHTFIVRDPRRAIESHYAINPAVTLPQIGFEHLHEIFGIVRAATGAVPPVLDADTLVRWPEQTVRAYCAAVGIPFDPRSLRWSPGGRPEWRRTSHWHSDAADSSAFRESTRRYEVRVDNAPVLADFYAHHLPFYEELLGFALPPRREPPDPVGSR
jgi:hypothetical protein